MKTPRRQFLKLGAAASAGALAVNGAPPRPSPLPEPAGDVPLDGIWKFRLDPQAQGESEKWQASDASAEGWRDVEVPHTWQIEPENTEYRAVAWYRRTFDAPESWSDRSVRIEFEAVFHTATVWVNGAEVGRHTGKGYTAFRFEIGAQLRPGKPNTVAVRVDSAFNDAMLPRGKSSDWARDGGIYRPVRLLVTPKVFAESLAIDTDLDLASRDAALEIGVVVKNAGRAAWTGSAGYRIVSEETGNTELKSAPVAVKLAAGESRRLALPRGSLHKPALWHFDHPSLYRLIVTLSSGHAAETTFGVRNIEIRDDGFVLNGERVRLMGAERMAGSNPEYGMAEPGEWIAHDHADMKELNCVYTRVHWPQDRRVLDWCDRHGILIQTEVPAWGGDTFAGMTEEPSEAILKNGLEQLREMIEHDRNHPCIFSWGVANEINGQNPVAATFVTRLYEEAKRLDPRRLVSYASNSLQSTPEKDVAGKMDYVMWNEYYESWMAGTTEDMARNLDAIARAFPGKPIVISEYGYCACTEDRPEGDGRRIAVLRGHDRVFRDRPYMAGLIFFDYNDYRTHIGDRGTGALKQRVHGVVDVYGAKKGSWDALRRESSPVDSVAVTGLPAALEVAVRTRGTAPGYALRGYQVRAIAYNFQAIPVERAAAPLGTIEAGETARATLKFTQPGISRIQIDVMRPTGFSAWTEVWEV